MVTTTDQDRQARLRRAGLSVDQLGTATHEMIVSEQQRLSAAGLYAAEGSRYYADGAMGGLTTHALRLENDNDYAQEYLTSASQQGGHRSHKDVMKLQAALNKMGYEAGSVDGLDGRQTQAAYTRFLREHPDAARHVEQRQAPVREERADRAEGLSGHARTLSSRGEFGRHVLPGVTHRAGQEVIYLGDSRAQGIYDADRSGNKVDGARVGEHLMHHSNQGQAELDRGLSRVSQGDKALISWGTNDFKGFVNAAGQVNERGRDAFIAEYREFIQDVKARGGEPVVLGFSATRNADMSPAQVNWLNTEGNQMLRGIARSEGAEFMATSAANIDGRNYHNNTAFNKQAAVSLQQM